MIAETALEPISVLLVEDNAGDARLVREILRDHGTGPFQLTHVERLGEAIQRLTTGVTDIILLDLSLPDADGLDTLMRMKAATATVPIVILTGQTDAAMALQAMRSGAQDYLPKNDLDRDRLLRVLRYTIERKRSEDYVRESDARFRALVHNSTDIVTILAADGTVLYESPALETVMGYRPEDVTGLNIAAIVHPDDLPRYLKDFAGILGQAGQTVSGEIRLRHADGSWRLLEATTTNLLDQPAIHGMVVNSRDITARRRSENEVRFQAQMLNTVDQAVIATDLANNVIFWNHFAETLYGWSAEEALGHSASVLTPMDFTPQADEIRERLHQGERWSGEFMLQRKDGDSISRLCHRHADPR